MHFNEATKFERNRIIKTFIFIIIMALVVMAIVGLLFYRFTYSYFVGNFERQHLEVASSLANAIDGDTYTEIFHSADPADLAEYRQILQYFVASANSSEDVKYAYTFHMSDDKRKVLYGFDGQLQEYDSMRIETSEFIYVIWFDNGLKIEYQTDDNVIFTAADPIPFTDGENTIYLDVAAENGVYIFKSGDETLFTIGEDNDFPYFADNDGNRVDRTQRRYNSTLSVAGIELDAEVFYNNQGDSVSYPNQVYVDEADSVEDEFNYLLSSETSPTFIVEDTMLGRMYTFYAPIFDKKGNKVARVGLDVDINILEGFSKAAILGFFQSVVPVIFLVLVVFLFLYYLREKRMLSLNGTIVYLNNTLAELKAMQDKLVKTEKQAALGSLISNIAHEINNPISVILNSSQLITERLKTVFERIMENNVLCKEDLELVWVAVEAAIEKYYSDIPAKQRLKFKRELPAILESKGIDKRFAENFFELGIYQMETVETLLPICERPLADEIFKLSTVLVSVLISSEHIYMGSKKISKIVYLLKLYSFESGIDLTGQVDISKTLDMAISMYQSQYGLQIVTEKRYDEGLFINGNDEAIQQVFMNLVQNAFQSMKSGGTLTVGVETDHKDLVITINDTGCGMNDEVLSRIYEPFFTTRSAGEGSGLGMFFVKNVLEHHSGEITISSTPGEGTRITVKIPSAASQH